jgi:AcrR family transcriptional regulator
VHDDSLARIGASLVQGAISVQQQRVRRRDPERKDRILDASTQLIASRGYHAVGMADIGGAAGIVGSGIYRHFPSKSAILTELLTRVMDTLRDAAAEIGRECHDDRAALTALVEHYVRMAIRDRQILQVYYSEQQSLAEDDLRKLRRAQRQYIEEWVCVLTPLRPELTDVEARLEVHAAMGSIQSILFHNPGLAEARVIELLTRCAFRCLDVPPAPAAKESAAG